MQCHASQQFKRLVRRKRHAHYNHEIHYLNREVATWLPEGIHRLKTGSYDPLPLKRMVFPDDVVDHVSIPDRIMQNTILQQLKPTFKHVIHPHCYHLHGPGGVKLATKQVRQALSVGEYHYFIRLDIKSFYASIPRYKLIQDINAMYDDTKVQNMLACIINNPIELPKGIRNPDYGIALRGPLSQFFGAVYLKPLDDALGAMDGCYVRYNDDCLLLLKTKRQVNRARRIISNILHERRLSLSRKKSRSATLENNFHFLGVEYLGTQPRDNTPGPQSVEQTQGNEVVSKLNRGG